MLDSPFASWLASLCLLTEKEKVPGSSEFNLTQQRVAPRRSSITKVPLSRTIGLVTVKASNRISEGFFPFYLCIYLFIFDVSPDFETGGCLMRCERF